MTVECIFGDWAYDPFDVPWCAFRERDWFPLHWAGDKIIPVSPAGSPAETMPYVALAAHWGTAHPGMLRAMVGPFVMDGYPRSTPLP